MPIAHPCQQLPFPLVLPLALLPDRGFTSQGGSGVVQDGRCLRVKMDHAASPVAFVVPRPRLHLSDSRLYFGGWVCGEGAGADPPPPQ